MELSEIGQQSGLAGATSGYYYSGNALTISDRLERAVTLLLIQPTFLLAGVPTGAYTGQEIR